MKQEPAELLLNELSAHITGPRDPEDFGPLALRVFAYQYAHNKPYRMFCDGRGATPTSVNTWQEIPPAPAAAFKRFALSCVPPELCAPEHGGRTFYSSGTTGSETSKHYMNAPALELYRLSLKAGYAHFVPVWNAGIIGFAPSPGDAPHSSLSFMLGTLGVHSWIHEEGKLSWVEIESSWFRLQRKPYTVFGTAFAWVQFFDGTDERFQLPPDCVIIETGGFKGRSREVERTELYRMFTERLGVPPTHCLAEYGMSEMASQFYDTTLRDHQEKVVREPRKMGLPHLVRTRVMNPVSEQEADRGEPGVLAHYDLANLNSCLAIQTEDWGYAHPDGEGFVLLGRAPGAALRGCSLTAEEFAARQTGG